MARYQDRRGFDGILNGILAGMPVSLLILIFYSWKIGLALLSVLLVAYRVHKTATAPPANGLQQFVRFLSTRSDGNRNQQQQRQRRPILACLGSSSIHGTACASITPEIPHRLATKLGMSIAGEEKNKNTAFVDPLWVVNLGRNGATSHYVRTESVKMALKCHPDYVMILIGVNDVSAVYKATRTVRDNRLPAAPTLETYEANLRAIIETIQEASVQTHIGVCTLQPMGEDLTCPANDWVRKANTIIERTVNSFGDRCTLIPVFERFESILEKKPRRNAGIPAENYFWVMAWMLTVKYLLPAGMVSWDALSKPLGHVLLSDGLHINDSGRDVIVDLVVEWLLAKNVAKAIAVKSM